MIRKTVYNIDNKLNKKIALFADIHLSDFFKIKKLDKVYNNLINNKPDYICIAGDIINDETVVDKESNRIILEDFLKKISKICPVIFITGNHDRVEDLNKFNYEYFNSLNKIKNVYYLNNNNVVIDDINFIGLNVSMDYYTKYEEVSILKEGLKNVKVLNNKYNILLFHSPVHLSKFEDSLKGIDLMLCGHMHNGMVIAPFKRLKGHTGLIGPYYNLFPKYAKGKVSFKDKELVISGGITKLSNEPFNKIDFLFASDIEYINI